MVYYILKSYKLKVSPQQIFAALRDERNCFFLDSSLHAGSLGRYSFLGVDPFYVFETKNRNPFYRLKEILMRYQVNLPGSEIPFLGGAVGYFAYDLGLILEEKIKIRPKDDSGIPDAFFAFYNASVIIDHRKKLLHIFCIGFPETKEQYARALCAFNFKKIHRLLEKTNAHKNDRAKFTIQRSSSEIKSNFSREEYLSAVKKAKAYIRAGDIYQVNLAQRFSAHTDLSAARIYERLRRVSPASFSAYLDGGDFQILSSSPERFLKLEDNLVTTRPMKGTRPRSSNRLLDREFKNELLQSAKDKAELVMIVDLERNDLGRVCSYDSVRVNRLRELERYSTVFQTTATVEGRLYPHKDRIDLLRACFPGGSITGCPKIRAMEIIEELEPARRSIYTGSLGYLSFSGNMDFNILIRTILKEDKQLYFGVGGGIVADSDPQEEYQETLVKAKGMLEAIGCKG